MHGMTAPAGNLLLVEAREADREAFGRDLDGLALEVTAATSWSEARRRLRDGDFDVVVLSLDLPDREGVVVLEEARRLGLGAEVVATSRAASVETVVAAVQRGASGFLPLPPAAGATEALVRQALERRELQRENAALRQVLARQGEGPPVVAASAAMRRVLETIERVARSPASVLLEGETGSGKGLMARTLHRLSARADHPFMHVNCGALQEQLLESELFGHEKGAFTGAAAAKPGLFEVAHQGTLFLDEIGELEQGMQAKLLQVLDAGELRRVGGTRLRTVDVRIVAATNRRLKHEVRDGRFREDLYFRLNVVLLRVPPLRERREDVPALVEHLLERFRPPGQPAKRISSRALQLLQAYHWPGNVRELANMLESSSLLAPGEVITPDDLPQVLRPGTAWESQAIDLPLPLSEVERLHIVRTLEYTAGKKAPAARLLKIDVKTLTNKIKTYGIEL